MTIEQINLGNYANDGTGDDLRTAFEKINANFDSMTSSVNIINGSNLGGGAGVFSQKNSSTATLEFKTLTSIDNSITITANATTVNLKSTPNIVEDTSPQLGGDLDLGSHYIYHGDVQTSIYGINVPLLNSIVELLIISNQFTLDFQTFLEPVETDMNMGEFAGIYNFSNNNLDFGTIV